MLASKGDLLQNIFKFLAIGSFHDPSIISPAHVVNEQKEERIPYQNQTDNYRRRWLFALVKQPLHSY